MAFQVLDMRISTNSNTNTGTTLITTTPLLIGDIGLITTAAVDTPLAGDVRVWLSGTVAVEGSFQQDSTFVLTIERNGAGTPGTGTLVYTESSFSNVGGDIQSLSVTLGDFPPVAVVNAQQIRYTLFVALATETAGSNVLLGPVSFNGIAAAGAGP
jgi:hypothetical protein